MVSVNPLRKICRHDEVAIMRPREMGREVLGISRVKFAGHVLIQTEDNGYFSASDGHSIGVQQNDYIEPATDAHRRALRRRTYGHSN